MEANAVGIGEIDGAEYPKYDYYDDYNGDDDFAAYDFWDPFRPHMHDLDKLIVEDRSKAFTEFLRSLLETCLSNKKDLGTLATILLSLISDRNSVKCAEALLKGDTGLMTVDLNVPLCSEYPLETVARKFYFRLTQLFLEHGAKANMRLTDGSLLMDMALKELRNKVGWTCQQSVYRLLFNLCGPRMFEPLMTVHYLASYLSPSEWSDILCRYGMEGKIIELAALLIMKPDTSPGIEKVYLPSNGHSSANKVTLRQHIINQIVFLTNEEYKLGSNDVSRFTECRQKKKLMMAVMLLLEIFHRDGYQIKDIVATSHCMNGTVERVANLLLTSGFELTGEDAVLVSNDINHKVGPERVQSLAKEKKVLSYSQSQMPTDTMAGSHNCIESENQQFLPLQLALAKLSSLLRCKLKGKDSIIKLISLLCLPQMKETLEIIKMLVPNTEKIHDVACYYAKEDKLIELAILLLVAQEKIVNHMTIHVEDNSNRVLTFRHMINSMLAQLVDLSYRLIGRETNEEKKLCQLCKKTMASILRALPMIEIFEKAGLDIEAYLRTMQNTVQNEVVAKDVARPLIDDSSNLKLKEIELGNLVDSSLLTDLQKLTQEVKIITEWNTGQTDIPLAPGSQLRGIPIIQQKLPYGMPSDIQRFILARYPRESRSSLSSFQPFRAFWTLGYTSPLDQEMALKPKPKEVLVAKQLMQKSQRKKQASPMVSTLRRGIKYLGKSGR